MNRFAQFFSASSLLLTASLLAACDPASRCADASPSVAPDAEVALADVAAPAEAPASQPEAPVETNPLLLPYETPFGVPPYDVIATEDYLPAFRWAILQNRAEVTAIADSPEPPTFANTIEALERSGKMLGRVASTFYPVNAAHSDAAVRDVAKQVGPELAALSDDIYLNPKLYARVAAVYQGRASAGLQPEQMRLLEETHKAFTRSGVNLPEADRARLREINAELSRSSQQFGENLLNDTNAYKLVVERREDLGALPESLVAAAAERATKAGFSGKWLFGLQRQSINPFLQYSPNRELRRQIFTAYAERGNHGDENDNKALALKSAQLRAERAKMLGYAHHADYVLADNVAQSADNALKLLNDIWPRGLKRAKKEARVLKRELRKDGLEGELEAWDWRYYTEKVRKARFDLDEEALRPYFEVSAVRDGVFAVSQKLFGLSFHPVTHLPKWHPDQQTFEVKDADGRHKGVLYLDFFARESKRGGAWMNSLRDQSKLDGEVKPIVTVNLNFPPPAGGNPSLLSYSEANTLFHEMGHALHGLLSDVTYESLSGTSVPRDFVEFPSQVMENWMGQPEVLAMFAKHYKTGEVIPKAMVEKLEKASKFNQGFATTEYMAATFLDLAWHTLAPGEKIEDVGAFEAETLKKLGLVDAIIPRYRTTYFAHIFSGGYSAGYYSYIWSEVLDADAFEAFLEKGLFDPATAKAFSNEILSRGGTRPGMESYEAFRGRTPKIEALLVKRGLVQK